MLEPDPFYSFLDIGCIQRRACFMAAGYFFIGFYYPIKTALEKTFVDVCIVLMLLSRANAFMTLLPAAFIFLPHRKKVETEKMRLQLLVLGVVTLTAAYLELAAPRRIC